MLATASKTNIIICTPNKLRLACAAQARLPCLHEETHIRYQLSTKFLPGDSDQTHRADVQVYQSLHKAPRGFWWFVSYPIKVAIISFQMPIVW